MEQPAIAILNDNRIMTIGTVRPDGWPQTTMVGYANEGWRLYFVIDRKSQKYDNIAHDNRVAVSIGHEPHDPSEIRAVYAGCIAREVTEDKERSNAWALIADRHPNLAALGPSEDENVAIMAAECRFLSVLDYSKGLGHRESLTVSEFTTLRTQSMQTP